jgi:hypothetical protein
VFFKRRYHWEYFSVSSFKKEGAYRKNLIIARGCQTDPNGSVRIFVENKINKYFNP